MELVKDKARALLIGRYPSSSCPARAFQWVFGFNGSVDICECDMYVCIHTAFLWALMHTMQL